MFKCLNQCSALAGGFKYLKQYHYSECKVTLQAGQTHTHTHTQTDTAFYSLGLIATLYMDGLCHI